MKAAWARKGYFDFSSYGRGESPAQVIRSELCQALSLPQRGLSIAQWPVGPSYRHMFWWRKGDERHVEAQFFMEVSKEYPVVSLGVSVEKGLVESSDPSFQMDRKTWHWGRLLNVAEAILTKDVPYLHAHLGRPVSVRIRTKHDGVLLESESPSFSYCDGGWWRRHEGTVTADEITDHLCRLDRRGEDWVDQYFAIDLAADDLESIGPKEAAARLISFIPIWKRFHA